MSRIKVILAAALVLSLATAGLWAQATSTITGTVKDSTGAVIPGVEVTVTSVDRGEVRTVLTGDRGTFRVTNLTPGPYEVRASLTGFQTAVTRLNVTVGEVATLALILEVGEVTTVTEVTDVASTVDTEQGRLSALVSSERLGDLPLNGRNVYQLISLAPGSVNTEATIDEPGQNASVNGSRANMVGFWMDGVTNTGLSGGTGAGDGVGLQPNLEALREFRIETLNFSAEFGKSVGGVVNVVTKSGGNQFHGSVYEYHRNDALDAREFFDDEVVPYKQNQFGFSLGGPIVRDKTFFFGTYEGTRIRTGESKAGIYESQPWTNFVRQYGAPVAQFLYGNYAQSGNTVDQTVGEYFSDWGYLEDGTQQELDALLGGLFGSPAGALGINDPMTTAGGAFAPITDDINQFTIRLDQEFGESDKLYGRYFIIDDKNVQTADSNRPAFTSPVSQRQHLLALNWTRVFSPTVVNEARTGLTRNITDIAAAVPGVPSIYEATGVAPLGTYSGYPQMFHENIFTYADTLSINKGDHGIKLGGEVRRNQENSEFNIGRPSYYFYDLIYLALDDPYYEAGGVDPTMGTGSCVTPSCRSGGELSSNFRGWRNWEVGLFFNDDWKVSPRLTLNLGVRWDYYSRLSEVQNRATAYQMPETTDYWANIAAGEFVGPVDKIAPSDWNNIAPRFGFAFDPFGDGKMSIRGGYGIAYQAGIYNPLANSRWNKPFYSFNLVVPDWGLGDTVLYGPQEGQPVTPTGPNPNPGGRNFEGNIIAYETGQPNFAYLTGIPTPRMRDPYVQSFFLGIQREIARETTLEVNYVGTLGRKLIRAENPNRFNGDRLGWANPNGVGEGDTSLNRINPNEGTLRFWENDVNSSYHALQAQFNRRYSGGFAVNANYTWAKSLDTRSTWHSGSTSSNLAQEGYSTDVEAVFLDYGRSIFDARQRLTASLLWDTPWYKTSDNAFLKNVVGGWQTNFILGLQSGQPWSPHCTVGYTSDPTRIGCDWNADGNNNDRPMTPSIGNSYSADRLDFVNPNGVFNISGGTSERIAYFGTPEPGTTGNLGRNTYDGPGFVNVDFSLFKEVGLTFISEDANLQLRFEFFNIFNRPNFFQPYPRLNSGLFGRADEQFDAREIQIGLKIIF